ncbi:MAG: hypothetical protein J5J00_10815 [Deltaproteobacteria bacterium]|nr:hypothetical protein [Deltaproteobacteria bacterium]
MLLCEGSTINVRDLRFAPPIEGTMDGESDRSQSSYEKGDSHLDKFSIDLSGSLRLSDSMAALEAASVRAALERSGSKNEAAQLLGVDRTTLYKMISRHGLTEPVNKAL